MLKGCIQDQQSNMEAKFKIKLTMSLENMSMNFHRVISVGTGCSGSDLVVEVLQLLQKRFCDELGSNVEFKHV